MAGLLACSSWAPCAQSVDSLLARLPGRGLLCRTRSWLGEKAVGGGRGWAHGDSRGGREHVALHKLLVRGVEVAEALEVAQRDVAHVRVALDVVPVDADEAVHVLEDHTHAQATEVDLGLARLAARVRAACGLDDVRVVLGPRRELRGGAVRAQVRHRSRCCCVCGLWLSVADVRSNCGMKEARCGFCVRTLDLGAARWMNGFKRFFCSLGKSALGGPTLLCRWRGYCLRGQMGVEQVVGADEPATAATLDGPGTLTSE